MEEEGKGFVLKDRRKISLEDTEPESGAETSGETPEDLETEGRAEESAGGEDREEVGPMPEVTFSALVFSFSSSALVHLGEIPSPESQSTRVDLPMAKQVIDTLGLLEEKTRGNLDSNEEQLLKSVLYDLRLRFLQKSGK